MCWSRQVSIAFAGFEAAMIIFIAFRALRSKDVYIRGQLFLLPLLLSVFAVETIEALLWEDHDDGLLVPVHESSIRSCTLRNKSLTMAIWLGVVSWQPLWCILPCRRVGSPRNRDLLLVPECLALFFGVANLFVYFVGLLMESPARRRLEESNFTSYLHTETCAYLGKSGHLHWSFATIDSFLTPNAFTYCLLLCSVVVARPWLFSSAILTVNLLVFVLELMYFRMSFESGSVWCWSAVFLSTYIVLQPYVLPIQEPMYAKVIDHC